MSKKNKLTPNQDKYKELRRRLKRRLSDLKKRGMTPNKAFDEEWVSTEIPEKPNKRLLKKMQQALDNIYKYVRYYDPLKEVYISGEERRIEERAEAARKGWEKRRENAKQLDLYWYGSGTNEENAKEYLESLPDETDATFNTIKELIDNWSADAKWDDELQTIKREDRDQLKSVFDGAIAELGQEQVIRNVAKNKNEIIALVSEVLFESGNKFKIFSGSGREGVRKAIDKLATLFWGRPLTVQESKKLAELAESLNESQ